jgi:hypothetical protein
LGTPSQLRSLAGQEHGRTIPLAEVTMFAERTRNSLALDVRPLDDGPSNPASAVWTWWCDRNAVALIARVAREHKLSVVEAARRSHLPIAGHQWASTPGTRGKRSHW